MSSLHLLESLWYLFFRDMKINLYISLCLSCQMWRKQWEGLIITWIPLNLFGFHLTFSSISSLWQYLTCDKNSPDSLHKRAHLRGYTHMHEYLTAPSVIGIQLTLLKPVFYSNYLLCPNIFFYFSRSCIYIFTYSYIIRICQIPLIYKYTW